MYNKKKKKQGFTIVELSITMVIIGVLSAVAIAKIVTLYDTSKRAATLGILITLRSSLASLTSKWTSLGSPNFITTAYGDIYMKQYSTVSTEADGVVKSTGQSVVDPITDDECVNIWNAVLGQEAPKIGKIGCIANASCMYEASAWNTYAPNPVTAGCDFKDKNNNIIKYDRINGTTYVDINTTTVSQGQNM